MTATLRPANDHDMPAILRIMRSTPWDKTAYLQRQLSQGNVVVAVEAGAVTGFVVWNEEFFSLPFIWLIAVAPEHRGKGTAAELFGYVEQKCAGSRLYSSTNESHAAMHRFFERRGYRLAGTADVDPGDTEVFYCIDL